MTTDGKIVLGDELAKLEPVLQVIDRIEAEIAQGPAVEMPVKHHFVRNQEGKVVMYIRAILMKAGTTLTSHIHATEHPYFVLCGCAKVWTPQEGWHLLRGPTSGITRPGTKRILQIYEDMIFITCHATNKESVEEIARDILIHRENPLIDPSRRVDLTKGEVV